MAQPVLDPLAHPRRGRHAQTRVWTDPGRLDPDWRPPRRLGSLPRWVIIAIPLAVVLALVATVAALGGFEQRTDRITRLPSDAVITSGPFRLTFSTAVAAPRKNSDDEIIWAMSVAGTIQLLTEQSDRPDIAGSSFVLANLPSNAETVEIYRVVLGARVGQDFGSGQVSPGLAPVPVTWEFEFPTTTPVTEMLRLIVWEQRYSDNTVTKTGELSWNLADDGFELLVPVTIVPADTP